MVLQAAEGIIISCFAAGSALSGFPSTAAAEVEGDSKFFSLFGLEPALALNLVQDLLIQFVGPVRS